MIKVLRAGIDRTRGIPPRLRSWIIYLVFGLKFKRFGRFSKLIGSNNIRIGNGVSVGDFCWLEAVTRYAGVSYKPDLRIGNRVALSDLSHISCVHKIIIGDDCLLGSKIYIGDHNHGSVRDPVELLSVPPAKRQLGDVGEIEIGSKTWICDGAVVLAGSSIASSSIIAANSVVRLREVRPALIAGVPGRVIRYLDGK